jgi:hypothetical protein
MSQTNKKEIAMLSVIRTRVAVGLAVFGIFGAGALPAAAIAGHHRHHHHHHHHHGIPQHNVGDHDADNNGGPSDGDGDV